MAKAGKKRLPFEVVELKGTVRKHRHGEEKDQPVVSDKRLVCSKDLPLKKIGRREWHRIMRISGTIRPKETDRAVLTTYCVLWERLCLKPETFRASDFTQLRLAAAELGFSPTARQNLRSKE